MRMLNPTHPGTFLRSEIVEAYGLSVTAAAKVLGISRPTLYRKLLTYKIAGSRSG